MNDDYSYSRPRASIRSRLFIYCLILSLLLHVLGFLTLPLIKPAEYSEQDSEPTYVRLIDESAFEVPEPAAEQPAETEKTEPETDPDYEVDPLPEKPEPQQPVESFRKAERDQQVEEEEAPEGDDARDETTARPQPQPQQPPGMEQAPQLSEPAPVQQETTAPQVTEPAPPQQETTAPQVTEPPSEQRTEAPAQALPEKTTEEATFPNSQPDTERTETTVSEPEPPAEQELPAENAPAPEPQAPQPTVPQLTPEQLLPNADTLDQIARGKLGDRNRVKEREDVEIGDTVWLNLQNDMLVSFFRRFRDRVERVWNYPPEAAQKGLEGTLELLIIVSKDGELIDVIPQQSSGSDMLDMEAIKAIYAAAPFGPLTRHYPHEQLRIRAYFRYHLTGRYIYGR